MTRHYEENKRWRLRHPETRHAGKARNYEKGAAHLTIAERREKRAWTPIEDAMLWLNIHTDRELAVILRRSVRGIQMRRYKLRRPVKQ